MADGSRPVSLQILGYAAGQSAEPWALTLDLHGARRRLGFFALPGRADDGLLSGALRAFGALRRPGGDGVFADQLLRSPSDFYPAFIGVPSDPDRYLLLSPGEGSPMVQTPGTVKHFLSNHSRYSYTVRERARPTRPTSRR